MSDLHYPATSSSEAQTRSMVLVIYGLYLIALAVGITGLVGVVLAYVKREDAAPGSLWRTHLENQIAAFWIWLVFMLVAAATFWFIVGFVIGGIGMIYFLYRTLKGLVRALDNRPY